MNEAKQQSAEQPTREPPARESPAPELPAERKRRPRRWLVVLGTVLALVGVTVLVGFKPLVRHLAVEQARERGIVLSLGEVRLGWSAVQIEGFRFSLVGLSGVGGTVDVLAIDLDGLTPVRLDARGANLEIVGTAATLAVAFSEWTKDYPGLLRIPAQAEQVTVTWRPDALSPVWLHIADAAVVPTASGGSFVAERTTVLTVDVGKVGASWTGDLSRIALGFGEADLDRAPVTIEVVYAGETPTADIALRPTPLEQLAGPLGVALPVEGVTASGQAALRFGSDPTRGPITGDLKAKLDGYSVPVPKELGAFVFGKTTLLETSFSVSDDQRTIELHKTAVTHGAFKLAGDGRIHRQVDDAAISLDLKGQLQCADLADAAARSHLGKQLGRLVGGAARLTLKGSVAVGIKIEATASNLAAAKLTRHIGVGCGLRSMSDLGLPELPELPELPDLSKLPKLPGLPNLEPE